jgi:hypothetical protein
MGGMERDIKIDQRKVRDKTRRGREGGREGDESD